MSFWWNIRNSWRSFSNFVSYKVGDDFRIRFWHDVRCRKEALKYSFSELYSISRKKEALGSSSTSEKKAVKDVRPILGLAPKWTRPSFAEVLRSDSTTATKTMPIVGDGRSWLRASLAKPCELDLLPAVRHAEVDPRSAVDCFSLESHPLDLLDKDHNGRPQGKYSRLNFESTLR